jgi:2-isopropylmalate synthase
MRSILIYDTTLRDGTQGEGVSLSLQDKLQITERLAELGIDYVEGGYPLSNEKDVQYFERVRRLGFKHTKVCSFGMTRRRGLKAADDPGMQALVQAKTPVCTVVGKTWDFHATEVLRVSLEENLAMIGESVEYLRQHAEVIYDAEHCFDGWNANPEYAIETLRTAARAGASWLVMCDTNGGTMPERVAERVAALRAALADYPKVKIGIHCHNDCDLAIANSLAAVDAGADQVQGTINGLGERCGNADLVSVMANLGIKKSGYLVLAGRPLDHLTELSRFVYETANMQLRGNQPFVGQSAFAHKGGMHVHAVNRAAHTYEHIDPAIVGNERRILVSELSGRSNIVALTSKHNLQDDRELMDRILNEVVRLENAGYQFETASASFDLLIRRCAECFTAHFEPIKYRIVAGDRDASNHVAFAEAIIKLRVNNRIRFEAAEGQGPVNALDAALRKSLLDSFPQLAEMRLLDYKVRVVNGEAGTAARIRVNIESGDDRDTWGTIGVSENIIEASWRALVDAVEYKLHKTLPIVSTPRRSAASAPVPATPAAKII